MAPVVDSSCQSEVVILQFLLHLNSASVSKVLSNHLFIPPPLLGPTLFSSLFIYLFLQSGELAETQRFAQGHTDLLREPRSCPFSHQGSVLSFQ